MRLNRFAAFAWGVVAYNLAVIVWGAYVRASGAGAGCGNHWPLCNGEVVPESSQWKTLTEFSHRLTSGLSVALIIGLFVWALIAYSRKHPVRRGSALSVFLIFTEALIGAALVLFGLVTTNDSVARAAFMSIHLVNTFLLLAALTLTAWWASGGAPVRLRGQNWMAFAFALGLCGTLMLAVSGAVNALGDTLFPAGTFVAGMRQDFSPTAHFLLRLRVLHPALAVLNGCYLIFMASYVSNFLRTGAQVRQFSRALTLIFFAQLVAGLLNLYLLAPVWLQLTHLLLADLLWIALVLFSASALSENASQDERVEHANLHAAVEI